TNGDITQATPTQDSESEAKSPLQPYELAIMRYLVRYGEYIMYDYVDEESGDHVCHKVAEYIHFDLERDGLSLFTPIFRRMLDEAVEHCNDDEFIASRYFLSHPDPCISQLAANLISDKYQLSKYHSKFRVLETEEQKLDYLVQRDLYSWKEAYTMLEIKRLQSEIKEAQANNEMDRIYELSG
ncbi:DNA primase, partial [gut metagenome]